MADKEEVEPTDESSSTEPTDAADALELNEVPGDTEPEAPAADDAEPTGTEPDEFDEIVRGSNFSGAHALGADRGDENDPTRDGGVEQALEPAGVGATAAGIGAGAVAERRAGRKPKEAATRRRDEPVKAERTGPVKFVKESIGELRKVVYPTGQQLINYFVVVLVFVLFIITYVSLLDLGLGALIFRIFS